MNKILILTIFVASIFGCNKDYVEPSHLIDNGFAKEYNIVEELEDGLGMDLAVLDCSIRFIRQPELPNSINSFYHVYAGNHDVINNFNIGETNAQFPDHIFQTMNAGDNIWYGIKLTGTQDTIQFIKGGLSTTVVVEATDCNF